MYIIKGDRRNDILCGKIVWWSHDWRSKNIWWIIATQYSKI